MTSRSHSTHSFWFRPVPTTGFGLMRVSTGLIAFISYLLQWNDVSRYYSDAGMLPRAIMFEFIRNNNRFSVLDYVGDPSSVFAVYLLLLACFALVTIGLYTRPALITGTLLLFSFHERMPGVLAGGDTVIRLLLFVLILAPCHRSFSLWSLRKRYAQWKKSGMDIKERIAVMSIWPYRLLLWQFIMIYVGSFWTKFLGTMWEDGSAVGIALHHEHFIRFPIAWVQPFTAISVPFAWFLLLSQMSWLLFLIIPAIEWSIPASKKFFSRVSWKLLIIGTSALIHGSIALFMDVGIFSFVIFAGYAGLLLQEDFTWLRRLLNGENRKKTIVLYDGKCGFCKDTTFVLIVLDALKRLSLMDLHSTAARRIKNAPSHEALMKEMHVMRHGKITKGFFAFRSLASDLPALWLFDPFLWLPGVPWIGQKVYKRIAESRSCTIVPQKKSHRKKK